MSAAALTISSITDGGASRLNKVSFWRDNNPGLATMARLHQPHLMDRKTRWRNFTGPLGTTWNCHTDDYKKSSQKAWNIDATGMITGPGLNQPVNADTAIKHIEELYDQHIRQFYTFKGKKLPAWCDHLQFECKVLGRNMATHGVANYAIEQLADISPIIKVRGHRVFATHHHIDSGATMMSPMLRMMLCRLRDERMLLYQSSILYQLASVHDHRKRQEFRNQGGLPGYSIAKLASVRLITYSEFHFPTVESRLSWMKHYEYLARRYGLGLEALYIDSTMTSMTLEQIESAKADIQHRIYSGDSPSSTRVRIKPTIVYRPKRNPAYEDCEASDDVEDEPAPG